MKGHDRFNPEFSLADRVLDVHVRSRFLTREEIEAIALLNGFSIAISAHR
jgi:hypothetical protein